MIIGYPSAVKIMAELVEQGELSLEAERVVTCGEPLSVGLRNYLERVFGTKVINFYGSSESLALGVETDQKEGMVLFDDMNIIEVVDGEMYVTCLYNYAQPLIRYHISDRLVLREAEEKSRYPFTTAAGLMGRDEDLLWFEGREGQREFLHPLAIEGFCVEGLKDYQFCQTGKNGGLVSLPVRETFPAIWENGCIFPWLCGSFLRGEGGLWQRESRPWFWCLWRLLLGA